MICDYKVANIQAVMPLHDALFTSANNLTRCVRVCERNIGDGALFLHYEQMKNYRSTALKNVKGGGKGGSALPRLKVHLRL